mmetsp:Transcript_58769/g.140071  ORF Transcript_58769/g.140071 Transcript_58769/m.140071 type:complete len:165 (+) Transcript_58769:99-593(+)
MLPPQMQPSQGSGAYASMPGAAPTTTLVAPQVYPSMSTPSFLASPPPPAFAPPMGSRPAAPLPYGHPAQIGPAPPPGYVPASSPAAAGPFKFFAPAPGRAPPPQATGTQWYTGSGPPSRPPPPPPPVGSIPPTGLPPGPTGHEEDVHPSDVAPPKKKRKGAHCC